MRTYVFDGTEVRKTGRTAVKVMKTARGDREVILVEVTPVQDFDWKKWCSPEQLYEVRENNENN